MYCGNCDHDPCICTPEDAGEYDDKSKSCRFCGKGINTDDGSQAIIAWDAEVGWDGYHENNEIVDYYHFACYEKLVKPMHRADDNDALFKVFMARWMGHSCVTDDQLRGSLNRVIDELAQVRGAMRRFLEVHDVVQGGDRDLVVNQFKQIISTLLK